MNKIITIGREFGSGGRELGRRLSERLGFAYYDQEVISEIAKKTSLSEQYVQNVVEHNPFISFPIHVGMSFYNTNASYVLDSHREIYAEQDRIIKEMAAKSDCVIVGRCADYILEEEHPFRIFVYADMDSKVKRCRAKGKEHEELSDKELMQHIKRMNRNRAKYYDFYTGKAWGDKLNYDLMINSTNVEIKDIASHLAVFLADTMGVELKK